MVVLAGALALGTVAPASAAEPPKPPSSAVLAEEGAALRTTRAALLIRIAELTDASDGAHARFVAAQQRATAASTAAVVAERVLVDHAVDAFVHSAALGAASRARGGIFADAVHEVDRTVLEAFEVSAAAAGAERSEAEAALAAARRAEVDVADARASLEATIAAHEVRTAAAIAEEERNALARRLAEEERARREAAAEAARAAQLAVRSRQAGAVGRGAPSGSFAVLPGTPTGESGGLPPAGGYTGRQLDRFARATAGQAALLAAHPFGPVTGLPPGMALSGQVIEGMASWYGPGFDGRPTASGALYDQQGWTVASKELPLGTVLLISRGDRAVLALVNDRGPYVAGRTLDLSRAVADELGTIGPGVAHVRAQVVLLP